MSDIVKNFEPGDFRHEVESLEEWLSGSALPLWLDAGRDISHGGFHERVMQNGQPCTSDNRRARVQPRQIYCFAAAGARGWQGDWQDAVRSGYDFFERVYRRSDGFYGNLASSDGLLIDDRFDLYNQAFALFAFAEMSVAFPDRLVELETRAANLLAGLKASYAHTQAGFEEAVPTRLPLCSNPHMHLFEASLAWEDTASNPATWTSMADEIARLAMTRFIDSESGALREFFSHDWTPFEGDKGRIVEPGHQFEWAWLLCRWGERRGDQVAKEKARKLFEIGVNHGLCEDRQVAIMGLYDDFSISDPVARLWPQTEWLKAAAILARQSVGSDREFYLNQAVWAVHALRKFLQPPVEGLWFDKLKPDGQFIDEPAPASSFYHILCAIYEARNTIEILGEDRLKRSA
ncbi:Cellobiose 2-epimerase [Roseibium album]|nr:Cellobiose 2-epimerase [Roseibium album]